MTQPLLFVQHTYMFICPSQKDIVHERMNMPCFPLCFRANRLILVRIEKSHFKNFFS